MAHAGHVVCAGLTYKKQGQPAWEAVARGGGSVLKLMKGGQTDAAADHHQQYPGRSPDGTGE